jgi:hypothetical protein
VVSVWRVDYKQKPAGEMVHTRDAEPKFFRKFCKEALEKRALSYARGPRENKGAQKVGTPGH